MLLHIYSSRRRVWLLVPDCMTASQTAVHKFGALTRLGEINSNHLSAAENAQLLAAFDVQSYIKITEEIGQRLLQFGAPQELAVQT